MIAKEILEQMGEDLKSYAQTETVFGKPLKVEGVTMVPVCRMSVGYGGGGGEGEGQDEQSAGGKGAGAGAGGGVKVEPAALVVIKDGEVSAISIQSEKESTTNKLLDLVPKALDKFIQSKGGESEEEEGGEEEEGEKE